MLLHEILPHVEVEQVNVGVQVFVILIALAMDFVVMMGVPIYVGVPRHHHPQHPFHYPLLHE
jgi:hypothetical protein